MQAEATGLLFNEGQGGRRGGGDAGGALELHADLVVGADGRHSSVRSAAGLEVQDLGAPIDVLWFRLSKQPGDPEATMGRFDRGRILVMLNRGDYWQCAFVIGKGSLDAVRGQGLEAFRSRIGAALPFTGERLLEIASWDDLKLLTVQVNRLRRWYREGLLCIGDAAHAMSPVGGVGINLAIQDAVAAANILSRRRLRHRIAAGGAGKTRVPDSGYPGLPGCGAEADPAAGPGDGRRSRRRAQATVRRADARPLCAPAPDPGAHDRHGRAPGAHSLSCRVTA